MAGEPNFCQYAKGPCDQDFSTLREKSGFFIYPSQPRNLAQTCKTAVEELQKFGGRDQWMSWEALPTGGQIIFCEICKALRSSKLSVGDISHLNFNVLFELGFALGLRQGVLPVRDTSYPATHLADIGIFDVLGYEAFQNSRELCAKAKAAQPRFPFSNATIEINKMQPIYYLKSPVDSDGSIKILSCLKKGYFQFRVFDPSETPRLSLHDAYRQVMTSVGVVAHLMDSHRMHSEVHNGRMAFICGMAMATEKRVLMIQEGTIHQPVDYRDVVRNYDTPQIIPALFEPFFRAVTKYFQSEEHQPQRATGVLERLDLGDVAAENEIEALRKYFIKTPQYQQTIQGHTRIVVGRKGSGKTAIFYGVREALRIEKTSLILDLKPEGHQLLKFREAILEKLSEGFQSHALVVFWEYLLLLEIAKKILERDIGRAYANPKSLEKYKQLEDAYGTHVLDSEGDFSERILELVDRIILRFEGRPKGEELRTAEVTSLIYKTDLGELRKQVIEYLNKPDEVWILFDNIDKGWPARGTKNEDITITRCLLEASRKLQRMFEARGQQLTAVVFLRKDVYDLLVDQTPDRGKDAAVNLDWSDSELIKVLLERRIKASTSLSGDFDSLWTQLFDAHIKGTDSFRYVVDRTFLRPRDVLNFVRLAVQIAVSHGHTRVDEEDLLAAERTFSAGMLDDIRHEIRDVFPAYSNVLGAFVRSKRVLTGEDLRIMLLLADVKEDDLESVIDTLLWFSFLGVMAGDEERYSYQHTYNIGRLRMESSQGSFVIHPAFHQALETP